MFLSNIWNIQHHLVLLFFCAVTNQEVDIFDVLSGDYVSNKQYLGMAIGALRTCSETTVKIKECQLLGDIVSVRNFIVCMLSRDQKYKQKHIDKQYNTSCLQNSE